MEAPNESWIVQLATWMKRRVEYWVRDFQIKLNGMLTVANLNVLPLGEYSILLGMDWMYLHQTKVYFFDNTIEFLDEVGEHRLLHGKLKPTLVRLISVVQSKRSCKKGCLLFIVQIPAVLKLNTMLRMITMIS